MKRAILLTTLLLCYSESLLCQTVYPYYDAMKLAKLVDPKNKQFSNDSSTLKLCGSILYNYLKSPTKPPNSLTYHNIKQLFGDTANEDYNPLINDFLPNIGAGMRNENWLGAITSAASSVGGLDVTNVADGLAKFMVSRLKEELDMGFFDTFKKNIDNPYLRDLFPETVAALDLVGPRVYDYSSYLALLRQSFKSDISNIYANLNVLLDEPAVKDFLTAPSRTDLNTIITSSLYIANQVSLKKHPGDVLAGYDANSFKLSDTSAAAIIRGSIQTIQVLSASLRDRSGDRGYWVDSDSIRLLIRNRNAFKIYLGLVFQEAKKKNITFGPKVSIKSLMSAVAKGADAEKSLDSIKTFLQNFASDINAIDVTVKDLAAKEKLGSSIDYTEYYSLFDETLDVVDQCAGIYQLPHASQVSTDTASLHQARNKLKAWINVAKTTCELYVDVKTKNYSSAITHLCTEMQYVQSVGGKDNPFTSDLVDKVLKYGTFMSNIIMAQNSDDVEAAIETVALPAGGAGIKRHSYVDLSVNSYLGLYVGFEGSSSPSDPAFLTSKARVFNSFGVTAPIGLAGSVGFGSTSLSVFASFFDIGAVAAFRFNGDSTKMLPTIQLKDIVSPGIFLCYGFGGNFPLSLNAGVQYSPNLHSVSAIQNGYLGSTCLRFSLSLCADIPLFDVVSSPMKKN